MNFNKSVVISLCTLFFGNILLATPSWENLGGSFQGNPFVVSRYDGRLEVFVRGTDNALWFAAQTSPGGNWTSFVSLGGIITSNPVAAADTTGRIAVFAVGTDSAVWTRSQIMAGIDNYSDWTSIGGSSTSDLAVVQVNASHATPTAYLFMRGPDGALWSNWTNETSGPWGAWFSLGGYLASAPGAGVNGNGQATVFVRGGDNALWYRQTTSPASITFNDWAMLGGAMNGPPRVAEINGYVMYRGMDSAAWYILDTTPAAQRFSAPPPPQWSDQASLGGYSISNPTLAPRHFVNNDQEIFVVGADNALWVTNSPGSGSPFGPWQSLGGYIVGDPFAQRNGDGTTEVFVISADGSLYHIRQSTAGSWQ